jgi:hypothetical protein
VFLVALVLFRKNLFEPMRLFFSELLIRECGIVTDDKLVAAAFTSERSHSLEIRCFRSTLTLLYCHSLHLLNFSGSADHSDCFLSPCVPLGSLASHGHAERAFQLIS